MADKYRRTFRRHASQYVVIDEGGLTALDDLSGTERWQVAAGDLTDRRDVDPVDVSLGCGPDGTAVVWGDALAFLDPGG